jgi:hypothetical protein
MAYIPARRPRIPVRRLPLAAEATVMLTVASLRVLLHPQSKTASLLGDMRPTRSTVSDSVAASEEILRIGRAVERMATVLPWHPVCLPRAVAVASMLRRRGVACRAHLGVTSTSPPEAHAWVTVGDVVVQGGPVDHVTELTSFV